MISYNRWSRLFLLTVFGVIWKILTSFVAYGSAIIEKLLNAKSEGSSQGADHIKSLKDVKELQLEPNPAFTDKASVGDGGYVDRSISPWICPLTSQEMNGKFRFVFDWSNGKVMSKRAYRMLKADQAASIAEENLIVINPDENRYL